MTEETQLLSIDEALRFVLFGLECTLDVELNPAIVEQVFSDTEADAVSAKRYAFWSGPGMEVTGHVQEYEPESLWLTIQSQRVHKPSLSDIVERAKYHVLRWAKWQEAHRSTDTFPERSNDG